MKYKFVDASAVIHPDTKIAETSAKATDEKVRVLLIYGAPGTYMAALPNSLSGNLLELAGGENIASDYPAIEKYPQYAQLNTERIVEANPEYIFLMTHANPDAVKDGFTKEMAQNPAWNNIDAVKNEHIEISGRLSRITSDGYVDRASSELDSYFLQGSYVDDNTLIKALLFGGHEITYQSWFGIDAETLATNRTFNPAGIYTDENGNTQFYDKEEDNYKQDHFQLLWNEAISPLWSTNIAFHYTKGRGYFEQFREDDDFATYGFSPIVVDGEEVNTTDLIRLFHAIGNPGALLPHSLYFRTSFQNFPKAFISG